MNEPPRAERCGAVLNSFSLLGSTVRRCKRLRRPEGPSLGCVDVRCRCIVPKVGGLVGGIILGSGLPPGTAEAQNFASGGCPAFLRRLSVTALLPSVLHSGCSLCCFLGRRVHARTSSLRGLYYLYRSANSPRAGGQCGIPVAPGMLGVGVSLVRERVQGLFYSNVDGLGLWVDW